MSDDESTVSEGLGNVDKGIVLPGREGEEKEQARERGCPGPVLPSWESCVPQASAASNPEILNSRSSLAVQALWVLELC